MNGNPYQRYFYDGTYVFQNKLDIHDGNELHAFEYAWSNIQSDEAFAVARAAPVLTAATLASIHHTLLGDIYPWAGHLRTVPSSKGGQIFLANVSAQSIDDALATFTSNIATSAPDASVDTVAQHLGQLWGELNYIHPFIEGNGRATHILLTVAAERLGWQISWEAVDKSDETYAGVTSCVLALGDRRFTGFIDILRTALKQTNSPTQLPDLDR